MQMYITHRIRRYLACLGIFLLIAATLDGFEVHPAQASPASGFAYLLHVGFYTPEEKTHCLYGKTEMEAYFMNLRSVTEDTAPLAPLWTYGTANVTISAQHGTVFPKEFTIPNIQYHKTEEISFTYRATSTGAETVKVVVSLNGKAAGQQRKEKSLSFEVKPCNYKVHGVTDMTRVGGAAMVIPAWKPVGTYDISGTIKPAEDGSVRGQATANLFLDALFTGDDGLAAEGITCYHTNPWEGMTTVEIEADPNAWAHEGELDLKFEMQPMEIAATQIICEGEGGSGHGDTPAFTIATFDLNFDTLPTNGGGTSLNFQFPAGRGEFEMDLIVSPEEVES